MPGLFDAIFVGGQKLSNRIVVSPMCQFASTDGIPGSWHRQHLGSLSLSGAGLLILESTAVSKEGRISPACLGLYERQHEDAHAELLDAIRMHSDITIGIQLAHSGRKGSVRVPWDGEGSLAHKDGGWATVAPSTLAWNGRPEPRALGQSEIAGIIDDYRSAARRAVAAGYQVLEFHAAHGYLIHQFLSPLTNLRDDDYGGDSDRRMRFPLEVFKAIREVVPRGRALGVRVSGTDWHAEGNGPEDAAIFAGRLEGLGADYFVVSSGGIVPNVRIPVAANYQVSMANTVKSKVTVPVMAVGLINDPRNADDLLTSGEVDMVALGRAFLNDPRWGWRAAAELGAVIEYPLRYQAMNPNYWRRSSPATGEQ